MPDATLPATVRYVWRPHRHGEPAEPVVRQWLGEQLDCPSDVIPLVRDVLGRPRLTASKAGFDVNWSHSGDGLLIGLGEQVSIGVDLERLRPRPRALDLAQRFFAPSELAWLTGLPSDAAEPAFIRLWCAKEAVLKAHGRGLVFGLDKLVFEDGAGGLHLRDCDRALGQPAAWSLHEFEPHPGYRAAMAWHPRKS